MPVGQGWHSSRAVPPAAYVPAAGEGRRSAGAGRRRLHGLGSCSVGARNRQGFCMQRNVARAMADMQLGVYRPTHSCPGVPGRWLSRRSSLPQREMLCAVPPVVPQVMLQLLPSHPSAPNSRIRPLATTQLRPALPTCFTQRVHHELIGCCKDVREFVIVCKSRGAHVLAH